MLYMVQPKEVSKKLIIKKKKVLTVKNRMKGPIHLWHLCYQMKEWQLLLRQFEGFNFCIVQITSLFVYIFLGPRS